MFNVKYKLLVAILFIVFSGDIFSNPIVVKLPDREFGTSYALEFKGDGNTFKFGKLFYDYELVIGKYSSFKEGLELKGEVLSFDDFREHEKDVRIVSYDGVMPATVKYKREFIYNDKKQVIYIEVMSGEVIKILKLTEDRNDFVVSYIDSSGNKKLEFSIDLNVVTASPEGISYLYEPTYGSLIYHPAKGWKMLYKKEGYHRFAIPKSIWGDYSADINYDNIIKSGNVKDNLDILFGQGLAEYIIDRNATQNIEDEDVQEYRQVQSIILACIMKYYEVEINTLYPRAFLLQPMYSTAVMSINVQKNIDLWFVRSKSIETKVKNTKLKLKIK